MIGLVVSGLLAVTASSASALTLGSLASSEPSPCLAGASNAFFTQTATATIPYTVPAGGGLISSWSTSFGPAGAPVELLVTGPPSGVNFPVVGFDAETLPTPIPGGNVSTFTPPTPIPVQAGDQLGLYYTGGSSTRCAFPSASTSDMVTAGIASSPASGATEVASTTFPSGLVNVSVNLLQSVDVGMSGSASPSAITAGDLASLSFAVTSTPASTGTFTDPVPTGLVPVVASAEGSSCTIAGQLVSCSLTHLPTTVKIAVQGATTGVYTNSASVAGAISDPNPSNNSASQLLRVSAASAAPSCKVVKLAGTPLAVAKVVIPALNCKIGKIKHKASKTVPKGFVISTSPRSGATSAVGSAVNIVISSGPRKKKHKKQ